MGIIFLGSHMLPFVLENQFEWIQNCWFTYSFLGYLKCYSTFFQHKTMLSKFDDYHYISLICDKLLDTQDFLSLTILLEYSAVRHSGSIFSGIQGAVSSTYF